MIQGFETGGWVMENEKKLDTELHWAQPDTKVKCVSRTWSHEVHRGCRLTQSDPCPVSHAVRMAAAG